MIKIHSIDQLYSLEHLNDDSNNTFDLKIKPYDKINYTNMSAYVNELVKTFFPPFIPYIKLQYEDFNTLKKSIYIQIAQNNFPLKSLESVFKQIDKIHESFIQKHKLSLKNQQTYLDYKAGKINIEDDLLRKMNMFYLENKSNYNEVYQSVKSNLLNKSNSIKSLIHMDKRNELYRDFDHNSPTLNAFIELYKKEFEISELLYDKIIEKEFIKINYLPKIESEFEKSFNSAKRTELGRMKEYLNNRLIELDKIPSVDTEIKKTKESKEITPIKLELNQTQIVYLFETLIAEKLINTNVNDKLWHLVSQYFIDKDSKPLNNIHKTKSNLKNVGKGKPKQNADLIENIVAKTKVQKP